MTGKAPSIKKQRRFYNCHVHAFTMDHVPDNFFSEIFSVSGILKLPWLKRIIKDTPLTGSFGFAGDLLIGVFTLLFGFEKKTAIRYITLVKYGDRGEQKDLIEMLKSYYPFETGFAILTMDLAYMGAGKPHSKFENQLEDLARIKNLPLYKNLVYPFVFVDPRRIEPKQEREIAVGNEFIGEAFISKMKSYLSDGTYQGIKIYPAVGYFPFDRRMKKVYDFALENDVPIMTHCTVGPVHFKYHLEKSERIHPFKGELPNMRPAEYQEFFTHPLNYQCLLKQKLLTEIWGMGDAPDYQNLKICIGHWGTGEEWHSYLENPWLELDRDIDKSSTPYSLNLNNWKIGEKEFDNFSWFSIICDLIREYQNVYADISFTLNDTSLLPLLKMILENDAKIRTRVLFGTDFYVVSKDISERAYSINIRSFLGKELFEQIAIDNAEVYLGNKFSRLENIGEVTGQ